jgi:hypothetical protein
MSSGSTPLRADDLYMRVLRAHTDTDVLRASDDLYMRVLRAHTNSDVLRARTSEPMMSHSSLRPHELVA